MSDALARPYFSLRERYTRVECQEPDYLGLWADIRTNLTNAERAAFSEEFDRFKQDIKDSFERRIAQTEHLHTAIGEATGEERTALIAERDAFFDSFTDLDAQIRSRRMERIAPYVRAWNVVDGDLNDVPAPKDGGVSAFAHTDDVILDWLDKEIRDGFLGGKGIRTRSIVSAPTPEPTSAPPSESETES